MGFNTIIKDEHGNVIDTTKMETEEQLLANKYINPDDKVLELGARYGSVSCVINRILSDKTQHVVVEPDSRVWLPLGKNREANNCQFQIITGFISRKKLNLTNLDAWYGGYGATMVEDESSRIKSYTLEEVYNEYNVDFNVLVADCEGCLESFFKENPDFINKLRLVIFEADYVDICNYDSIREYLIENGFNEIKGGFQSVYSK